MSDIGLLGTKVIEAHQNGICVEAVEK